MGNEKEVVSVILGERRLQAGAWVRKGRSEEHGCILSGQRLTMNLNSRLKNLGFFLEALRTQRSFS